MWSTLLPLVAISTVDRAGVPTALIAGILILEPGSPSIVLFTLACILASLVGDLACYAFGVHLAERGDRTPVSFQGSSTLFGRVAGAACFIDSHPLLWQVGSRAFPLVNQVIPMAAGIRRRPLTEAVWTNLVGGVVWLGGWAFAAGSFSQFASEWPAYLRWGAAALGVVVLGLAIKGTTGRSRARATQEPDVQSSSRDNPS